MVQAQRKPSHESLAGISPIAVTVSRAAGQSGPNPAGRSSTGGVAPGTCAAEAGGNSGTENGESSTGQWALASAGGASGAVGPEWPGREEKWSGVAAGPATPSATPRTGGRGGRPVSGGGADAVSGDVSPGFGSGGEEGGGPEDVEEVAKRLDFHTVFD